MKQVERTYDRTITLTGLLCTAIITVLFFYWGGDLTNRWAIIASTILSFSLQLAIWFCNKKSRNYGKSLIMVMAALTVISLIPHGLVVVGALGSGFVVIFLWELLRGQRLGAPLLLVAILAVLYGALIFVSGTAWGSGDPFIDEYFRQFSARADLLFFSALSTMFRNYGVVSTGLHGLPWVHYHWLAYALYGWLSNLLSIEPYECYGYVTFIVFNPVLTVAPLFLMSEILSERKNKWLLMNLLVLGSAISEPFGWLFSNHYISESFTFGLLFLVGALSIMYQFIKNPGFRMMDFILLLIYIPIASLAKISSGCILAAAVAVAVFFNQSLNTKRKVWAVAVTSISGFIGYKLARIVPIKGRLEMTFHWEHLQKAIGPDFLPLFFLEMFPYFILALPGFFILRKGGKLHHEIKTWYFILFSAVGIGFAALNFTIDSSGGYFSHIHAWVALPIIAILFDILPGTPKPREMISYLKSCDNEKTYSLALTAFFVAASTWYFVRILPREMHDIIENKKTLVAHIGDQNRFLSLFSQVRNDPDPKLMVYIPKTETDFWVTDKGIYGRAPSMWYTQCACVPLYVTALTGKPSLFGLPDPAWKCSPFHRGYEVYSSLEYDQSGRKDYSHEELCAEVLKRGFHGYYRLTTTAEKRLCSQPKL